MSCCESYTVFMIDPPWAQKKGGLRKTRPRQDRKLDYPTCSLQEIQEILKDLLPDHPHCVFLWEIDRFLIQAEIMMESMGYRRHARLIWDKGSGVAPAFTIRYTHEYLVWWYKPRLVPIASEMRGKLGTVIRGAQREHSRKPDEAYRYVESLYPTESRMDVFAREERAGWALWGNDVTHFSSGSKT